MLTPLTAARVSVCVLRGARMPVLFLSASLLDVCICRKMIRLHIMQTIVTQLVSTPIHENTLHIFYTCGIPHDMYSAAVE